MHIHVQPQNEVEWVLKQQREPRDAENRIVVAFASLLPDLLCAIAAFARALQLLLDLQRLLEVIDRLVDFVRVELHVAARAQCFRRERALRVAVDELHACAYSTVQLPTSIILYYCKYSCVRLGSMYRRARVESVGVGLRAELREAAAHERARLEHQERRDRRAARRWQELASTRSTLGPPLLPEGFLGGRQVLRSALHRAVQLQTLRLLRVQLEALTQVSIFHIRIHLY